MDAVHGHAFLEVAVAMVTQASVFAFRVYMRLAGPPPMSVSATAYLLDSTLRLSCTALTSIGSDHADYLNAKSERSEHR